MPLFVRSRLPRVGCAFPETSLFLALPRQVYTI